MQQLDLKTSAWHATAGSSLTIEADGRMLFNDGAANNVHFVRLTEARLRGCMVHVALLAHPLPGCSTQVLLMQPQIGPICRIAADGTVTDRGGASTIEVQRRDDGSLAISVTYFAAVPLLGLGTANPGPFYSGTGRPQFAFEALTLAVAPVGPVPAAQQIVVVDVGPDDRFGQPWRGLMPGLLAVAVARPTGASPTLREDIALYPGGRLLEVVLYNKKGRRKLNRTSTPMRSSLLAVERRTLRKFADPARFEVLEQVSVDCVRYDELHAAGTAPAPDVLRLDAQGAEYEVLQGFGALLGTCLAVQVRTALYPLYKGQKLLTEIAALLEKHDFTMTALVPLRESGQVVEAQASFVKSADWAEGQSDATRARLATLRGVAGFGG